MMRGITNLRGIVHLSIITSLGSYFPLSKSLDDLTMYKKNYTPQPCEIHASMQGRFDIQKSVNTICHNSKLKLKKLHDHINKYRKSIWQNPIPTHDKNSQ